MPLTAINDRAGATSFPDLPPGAYTVDVTGLYPGAPIAPVTSTTLIWPTAPDDLT